MNIQNNNSLKDAILYHKNLILQEIEEEKEAKRKELIELSCYKKGEITKEVFKLPMSSADTVLTNNDVDLRVYGSLILFSNWGGKELNLHNRYLYSDTFKDNLKEIAASIGVGETKIKRDLVKLRKCNLDEENKIKMIDMCKLSNGSLVYLLNYGTYVQKEDKLSFEKYVTITNVALRILINATNDRMIRIYLFMLYKLRNGERCLTQAEICEKVGLSTESTYIVSDCVNSLCKLGFIDISVEHHEDIVTRKNGTDYAQTIPKHYYSLSERYFEVEFNSKKKPRRNSKKLN